MSTNEKVSLTSLSVSPKILTGTVWLTTPGANVSTPLVGATSRPAVAVPFMVEKFTVTILSLGADNRTTNAAVLEPWSPSVIVTSFT